jgi:hypothetical protein
MKAGLAGVVDRVGLGQNLGGLGFQIRERFVQRPNRDPADLDRVELLKAVERARNHGILDLGDRVERDELAVCAGDIDVA